MLCGCGEGEGPTTQIDYWYCGLAIFILDANQNGQLEDNEVVNSIVLMADPLDGSSIPQQFRYRGLGLGSTHADVVATIVALRASAVRGKVASNYFGLASDLGSASLNRERIMLALMLKVVL
jgi:hypothetical protein